jgi:hypothetical protein
VTVDHNHFDDANGGIQGHGVTGLSVTDNVFQSNVKCDDQIGVFGGDRGSSGIIFADNVVDKGFNGSNRGWGRGIIISTAVKDVLIKDNRIENINSTAAVDYNNPNALGAIILEVFDVP